MERDAKVDANVSNARKRRTFTLVVSLESLQSFRATLHGVSSQAFRLSQALLVDSLLSISSEHLFSQTLFSVSLEERFIATWYCHFIACLFVMSPRSVDSDWQFDMKSKRSRRLFDASGAKSAGHRWRPVCNRYFLVFFELFPKESQEVCRNMKEHEGI